MIERLQRRIAELKARRNRAVRMPGLKAKSARKPPAQQGPRKERRHGLARPRMTPTHRVEHVMENCPDCGAHLSGGWTHRMPVVPAQVRARLHCWTCPACRRRTGQWSWASRPRRQPAQPDRHAAGRGAAAHQVHLDTVHQLRLSVGEIHRTAQRAQPAVAAKIAGPTARLSAPPPDFLRRGPRCVLVRCLPSL